jgi:hypothetical protein
MYAEGTADMNEMIVRYPFLPSGEKDTSLAQIKEKARNCYFPAFEKVNGSCFTFKSALRLEVVFILTECLTDS